MTEMAFDLSAFIQRRRAELRLSVEQLADNCEGYGLTTVEAWDAGTEKVPLTALGGLAQALRFDATVLILRCLKTVYPCISDIFEDQILDRIKNFSDLVDSGRGLRANAHIQGE